jgi:polar amino acid transport system substrate-binding protein
MRRAKAVLTAALFAFAGFAVTSSASALTAPPKPGESAKVDAIRKAGVLRVGVQDNQPWLAENTTGTGEPWAGPAWLMSKKFAELLGVKLEAVRTSNETKVTLLAANQADMSISALGESEERKKVVDFVTYSVNSTCMVGLKSNAKFAKAAKVEDLDSPDFTLVYGIGAPDDAYLKKRFPKAKLTGAQNALEEVLAGHADSTPYNRVQVPRLMKKVPDLITLPKENNCADSKEQALDIGMAIDKGNPEFLKWLQTVADEMRPDVVAEERRVMDLMK